jgi:hypothetical protein
MTACNLPAGQQPFPTTDLPSDVGQGSPNSPAQIQQNELLRILVTICGAELYGFGRFGVSEPGGRSR